MRFTFRQLEYFVAAGDTGSVRLAAQRVNISQPSVSAAIAQLEEEFGVQLFVRHHAQGLALTAEGERLLREAKALLHHAEAVTVLAGELSSGLTGSLAVGFLTTLAPLLIPTLTVAFGEEHPQLHLEVSEDHHSGLMQALLGGRLSMAITYDLELPVELDFDPALSLPPYALLSARHPLASRHTLSLGELAKEPYVMLDLPLSREYFLGLFLHENVTPNIAWRSPQTEVVRALVAAGNGFGLANARPRNTAALDGEALAYVPLRSGYRPLTVGLVTLKGAHKSRALTLYKNFCKTRLSKEIPGMLKA